MKIEKMQRLDSFIRANLGVWPCPERNILIDESWENGHITKSKFCTRKEFTARAVELGYKVAEKEKSTCVWLSRTGANTLLTKTAARLPMLFICHLRHRRII